MVQGLLYLGRRQRWALGLRALLPVDRPNIEPFRFVNLLDPMGDPVISFPHLLDLVVGDNVYFVRIGGKDE
jgi:hypothetical protein